jgi:tetratricopeptide (TPR) repeat protein
MAAFTDTQRKTLIALALALGTFLVYWPVCGFEFIVYDDLEYVVENSHINRGLCWAGVGWAFTHLHGGNWHPLTTLMHMAEVQLFGLDPAGHHLVNAAIHAANTVLVFLLLGGLTGSLGRSAVIAALFGWHPLRVESVAWVSELKDVLSTLFALLVIGAYGRYVTQGSRKHYRLALALFALGLMAKPMLVTLPFGLLLLDAWPLHRFALGPGDSGEKVFSARWIRNMARSIWPFVMEKLPFFGLSLLASAVTFVAQRGVGAMAPVNELALAQRLANALVSYISYLGKTFWPVDLAAFYPLSGTTSFGYAALAALTLVGISFLACRWAARRPYVLVGWLWFVGTLVPVIGLVQVGSQAMADRYTYIPHLGLLAALVWTAADATGRERGPLVVQSMLACAVLAVCLALTRTQLGFWHDSRMLFEQAIAVTENNAVAHVNLGFAAFQEGRMREVLDHYAKAVRINPNMADQAQALALRLADLGRTQEAIAFYTLILRANADHIPARYGLANALVKLGRFDDAIGHYRAALKLDPRRAEVHNNLGFALAAQQRFKEAIEHYEKALQLRPQFADAHNNMAVALEHLERYDEAARFYRQALAANPKLAEAHINLGFILARQNQIDEARPHFEAGIKLKPDDAQAHCYLGLALASEGKLAQAVESLRTAIRLKPDWPLPLKTLAWMRATHPDAAVRNATEAESLAEQLCRGEGAEKAENLDVLAAAYAEAGRFSEAASTAQRAVELARAESQPELTASIEARLALYRQGKPFRDAR